MPGPVSGWAYYAFEDVHQHCRDGMLCQGTACVARTGKTGRSRHPRPPAKRTRERAQPPAGYVRRKKSR